jgi:hypothetical protein
MNPRPFTLRLRPSLGPAVTFNVPVTPRDMDEVAKGLDTLAAALKTGYPVASQRLDQASKTISRAMNDLREAGDLVENE